jgi:NTE family protein/lysophospholipid hydrolase
MQLADRIDFLARTELFRGVTDAAIREIASEVRTATLQDGDVLIRQEDLDRHLYLVVAGRLRVRGRTTWDDVRVLSYAGPGETIGEMALLSDEPAFATVDASGETTVAILDRATFDRFSAAYPQDALHVVEFLSRRLQHHRLAVALHLSNLFDTLDPNVVRDLESELEMFMLYGSEVLFREGEAGDYFCIVVNGRVRVTRARVRGEESRVAELGPGEIVGEMAVVTDEPRSATVVAVRDSQLARLTKAGFQRVMAKHPAWAFQMVSRTLARRLHQAGAPRDAVPDRVSTVAVVPIHRSAPAGAFCQELQQALSQFGPAIHLTSARVDEHLGQPGIAQAYERGGRNTRVIEWLASQEIEHRFVLYESDPFLSPWAERCVRQADHIILLGEGDADPAPCEIEVELLAAQSSGFSLARQWLVLAHGRGEPSGTRRWLDARHVERHCHVRLGDRASFERLARLLAGSAVGLTLGGGFARGLAHLGVFRAFEEFGVPIDAIGSASMGAMLGGLLALRWDRDRIMREVRAACSDHFGDMTFPFVAIKRGRKFSEGVRRLFGDVQIEDLWTPFFCISANLNRSELMVHARGSLAKAVLASTRAPGVFPPIVYDGELHVDGGVINNVPVDLTKGFCNQGLTIGVDVAPPHELNPVRDYGDAVSGWRTFWARCFSKNRVYTPSILLVMIRTLEYTGISNQNERLKSADIFMYPDMLRFRRTDFHLADQIVQAGYDCARASLLEHRDKFVRAAPSFALGREASA